MRKDQTNDRTRQVFIYSVDVSLGLLIRIEYSTFLLLYLHFVFDLAGDWLVPVLS